MSVKVCTVRILVVLCLALLLCLCACQPPRTYEHAAFVSQVGPEDCRLCGAWPDCEAGDYWGQDNLGVVCLNTFELRVVEINRYDNSGAPILEPVGAQAIWYGPIGRGRYDFSCDQDRGYAHVTLTPEGEGIDAEAISSYLCQDCLDDFAGQYFLDEDPPALALLNLKDRTLLPLRTQISWFTSGNYGISCRCDTPDQISLLLFYCPPRFGAA